MRAVIQRVKNARVHINDEVVSEISRGMLVLLGIQVQDTKAAADYVAEKIAHLRIFEDSVGKMNLSVNDIGGELMIVSQFTLYGDCRKGNRPSFIEAAKQDDAKQLFDYFLECVGKLVNTAVQAGVFSADMNVELINDGPVTILIDSSKSF